GGRGLLNLRVLDTTVASLILNQRPQLALYQPLLEDASLVLSFQTVAEMRFGALRANWAAQRKRLLEEFFSSFFILEYTDQLATCWAEVMNEARKAGRRLETGRDNHPYEPSPCLAGAL